MNVTKKQFKNIKTILVNTPPVADNPKESPTVPSADTVSNRTSSKEQLSIAEINNVDAKINTK